MPTVLGELKHHGVMGMRWGVRRQAKRNVKKYRSGILKRFESTRGPISRATYDSMSSKDVKIAPAGANLLRVGMVSETKLGDKTYVSLDSNDHNIYKSLLDSSGGAQTNTDLIIKNTKPLISPSKKTRIDTLVEVLDQQVPAFNGPGMVTGRSYLEGSSSDKQLSTLDLALKNYSAFAQTQGRNTPLHQKFFDSIQKKGYNALEDDGDAGIVSSKPIIVFTKKAGASVQSTRNLSVEDILTSQLNLKDFAHNFKKGEIMATVLGELKHHGVKGMRWGVRKKAPRRVHFQDTETGEISKRKYDAKSSSDYVRSRELKRMRTHKLSNAQIEKVNKRLQLEVSLRSLKEKNSTITIGKKKVATILAGLGAATTLYGLATSPGAEKGYNTLRATHPEWKLPPYKLPKINISIPKL